MFDELAFPGINNVKEEKVQKLVDSMLNEGWKGAPILHHNSIGLITGSHRMEALNRIEELYEDDKLSEKQIETVEQIDESRDYELDVTDIIDDWIDENPEKEMEFDELGAIFKGTEIEEWKNEIAEW